VKPILLYGSEIWGGSLNYRKQANSFDNWFKEEIEKCHLKYCRFLLGVNRRTPILAILGETGRFPLVLEVKRNMVKYWLRIKDLPADSLLYKAYIANISLSPLNNWTIAVEDSLHETEIFEELADIGSDNIFARNISIKASRCIH
jgi:hypothetical protein